MSKNEGLRFIGIVLFIFAVQGLIRPLISMFVGHSLTFNLFYLPSAVSFVLYVTILTVGILLVNKTKPFDGETK
ncbi:hypothetical protein [Peribacillus muralis]|uniref:hypothetical protein n=1 Tax=Peribacillus muralis TaxID=264697 RepID=UPI00070C5928|nr:hypothetical protein [Peribacillus muralis]